MKDRAARGPQMRSEVGAVRRRPGADSRRLDEKVQGGSSFRGARTGGGPGPPRADAMRRRERLQVQHRHSGQVKLKRAGATLLEDGKIEGTAWARFRLPARFLSFRTVR